MRLVFLGDEWSFESQMAKLGCMVHSYDPTVKLPQNSTNLNFYPMGLGPRDDPTNSELPVLSFETILKQNGDWQKPISYLKMDIEQNEIEVMKQLIEETTILENVHQIGIEIHTGELYGESQISTGIKLGNQFWVL